MTTTHFYHKTVLLKEATDALMVKKEGIYVDATFGGGGHSKAILEQLGENGRLIAFDQDADAWRNKPDDSRLIPVKENFRYLNRFLKLHGFKSIDGIIADLGVSSFQFDTAERGFSIRTDGPLDMKMDKRAGLNAAIILKTYTEAQLHQLFELYGEVRNSRQLARHIVAMRKSMDINTTEALKAILAQILIGNPNKYMAQVFQALRIEVNDEMGALKELLAQAAISLNSGGRLSVISFHSLEDRLVKQFIKKGRWDEPNIMEEPKELVLKPINAKPIEPSAEEVKENPRARSAHLRIAEKI